MAENEEIDKNHTLSDMARLDKRLLTEVITLYTTWYDDNWKDYIRAKYYVHEMEGIYKALTEDKLILSLTKLGKNPPNSYTDTDILLQDIDFLFEQKTENAHHHKQYQERMDLVWPILKRLKEAIRNAANNANMLNMEVKGHAQTKAIRELSEKLSSDSNEHRSAIARLETELRELRLLLPVSQRSVDGEPSEAAGGPVPPPDPPGDEAPATDKSASSGKRGGKLYNSIARVFGGNKITPSDRALLLEQLREMI
jgi:uncharacterized coiled-coil protein SlyX